MTRAGGTRRLGAEVRALGFTLGGWLLLGCGTPPGVSVDLVGQLPLAEVETATRVVDFGTPGARPHLRDGWSYDESTAAGRTFVWGEGSRSLLSLVVVEPRDLELRFRSWSLPFEGAPPQTLEVRVAGQLVAETEVATQPRWYTVRIPGPLLVPGSNLVELRYARQHRPRDVIPGARDVRSLAVAFDKLRVVGARNDGAPAPLPQAGALRVPLHAAVVWYWMLPRGATLRFDGLEPWGADGRFAEGLRLDVEVQAAGGGREVRSLAPGGPRSLEIDATPQGPVRVALRVTGEGTPPGEPVGLDLVRPVLEAAAPEPPLKVARGTAPPTPPNVIFYLIDTLRPDHLGAYGYDRPTSPNIDAFAREASVFRNAIAQSPWTRPSVASIFTGRNPQSHGVTRPDRGLPALPLLPALLKDLGYRTFGVVTNAQVSEAFGFDRGFDTFRYLPERVNSLEYHQLSDRVNQVALRWLDGPTARAPFFLYLHTSDPHTPYAPREPYRERFAAHVTDPAIGTLLHLTPMVLGGQIEPSTAGDLMALYDAEIAFNDASFGAFLDQLRERGLYEPSLIVLVSDHGEAFAEHGTWQHGTTLYSEELRVALIVKFPDGRWAGQRVEGIVTQVDLLPTLLEVLGQPVPAGVEGRSALPLLAGREDGEASSAVFAHLARNRGEWESARVGDMKLIRTRANTGGTGRVMLFDVAADPDERRDLAQERPVWRGYLLSRLRQLAAGPAPAADAPAVEIDPELRERLQALGYL